MMIKTWKDTKHCTGVVAKNIFKTLCLAFNFFFLRFVLTGQPESCIIDLVCKNGNGKVRTTIIVVFTASSNYVSTGENLRLLETSFCNLNSPYQQVRGRCPYCMRVNFLRGWNFFWSWFDYMGEVAEALYFHLFYGVGDSAAVIGCRLTKTSPLLCAGICLMN